MEEEQKAARDINRALHAQQLLENDLLKDAFAFIEREFYDRWKVCNDSAERDRLWMATAVTERVQNILRMHVENGKVAKAVLNALQRNPGKKAA